MSSCFSAQQLVQVQRPYQYVGYEENTYKKNFDEARLKFCLAFPDSYEVGMSNLGIQILYHVINEQPDLVADRVFAPLEDMAEMLRNQKARLESREYFRNLQEFDCIGFTLQYELCYTNVLYMLDLAGLPRRSEQRREQDPFVIAGGPCVFNAEPVADFFDFVVLGEGEDVILEIADALLDAKEKKLNRHQTLLQLSKIKGIYVPSFYTPQFNLDGHFDRLDRRLDAPRFVERRIVKDLDAAPYPKAPVTPSIRPVHERLSVEVQRGCTRSCRFCQAGYVYRPRRERNPKKVMEIIEESVKKTGNFDIGLLSLSTADYGPLHSLMKGILSQYQKDKLSISMPSTRLEALKPEYLDVLKEERKTGFTIAPEAGSQRMRAVINKNFTEQEIIDTASMLFQNGWQHIKMYFMIGLPTEKDEDVIAIAELANTVYRKTSSIPGSKKITVSVSNFVPKPQTPFQWHPQISLDETFRKQQLIREHILFPKSIHFKAHNPNSTFVEGIIARADRRCSFLIERAYEKGAVFDCWQEKLNSELWKDAAAELASEIGVDLIKEGHRERTFEERLPWHRLYAGLHPKFYKNEYHKAVLGIATEDCSFDSCHECGLCNEKTQVHPVVLPKKAGEDFLEEYLNHKKLATDSIKQSSIVGKQKRNFRFQYKKINQATLLSTLELQKIFYRSISLAGISFSYSQGVRSRPHLSMGPALSVGVSSFCELFDAVLFFDGDAKELQSLVNPFLPEDLSIMTVVEVDLKVASIQESIEFVSYRMDASSLKIDKEDIHQKIESILNTDSLMIERERNHVHSSKVSRSKIDIRPFIKNILWHPDAENQKKSKIFFTLESKRGQSVNPYLFLKAFNPSPSQNFDVKIEKMGISMHETR